MKQSCEIAVECASDVMDRLIEWGVTIPRDIKAEVAEEVSNTITTAIQARDEDHAAEVERLKAELESARAVIGPVAQAASTYAALSATDEVVLWLYRGDERHITAGMIRALASWLERQGK